MSVVNVHMIEVGREYVHGTQFKYTNEGIGLGYIHDYTILTIIINKCVLLCMQQKQKIKATAIYILYIYYT